MSIYLDASVLISLFTADVFSDRADRALRGKALVPFISDFAAAEFASSIGRRVRMREMKHDQAKQVFADFDRWVQTIASVETMPGDIRAAEVMLRRLDLTLRTPDALNLAIVQRLDAQLATFDKRMAACARTLDLPLVSL